MGLTTAGTKAREGRRAAKAAGLVYVQDDRSGYCRQRRGRGFHYTTPHGQAIRSERTRERIAALAIPPAWTSVWICADESGHLQATGFDARGRKQYRYHADWRATRDATKYHRLAQFAAALPALRRRVQRALRLRGMPRDKVLAALIRLLDVAGIRVGNREYARSNGSFGLTTLQDRHVQFTGPRLQLRFRGKGGQPHCIEVDDRRLARIVRRCSELPGQRLFQFLDDEGKERPITSGDLNGALQQWTAADFTAKDFRTWSGSVSFLQAVRDGRAKSLTEALQQVAQALGNTPAICRKHYIHPILIEHFLDGRLQQRVLRSRRIIGPRGLNATERLLLKLLPGPQLLSAAGIAPARARRSRSAAKAAP